MQAWPEVRSRAENTGVGVPAPWHIRERAGSRLIPSPPPYPSPILSRLRPQGGDGVDPEAGPPPRPAGKGQEGPGSALTARR